MFLDKYEVEKEEAEELISEAIEFVADFGNGKLNIEKVFKELEDKTGIELTKTLEEIWS